jgi:hypothetical protein
MLLDAGKMEFVLECEEPVDSDSRDEDLSVDKYGYACQQRLPGEDLFLSGSFAAL